MTTHLSPLIRVIFTTLLLHAIAGCDRSSTDSAGPQLRPGSDGEYHVYEGESIQAAVEAAAHDEVHKTVRVHSGIYRPSEPAQALVWFNRRHDGVRLLADGDVTLTAANEMIADASSAGFPAIVNHVLYFGDGISPDTLVSGFRITGANNFVTQQEGDSPIEPGRELRALTKGLFFYADGGGIKIFGRSYPTIRNMRIVDNYASPCGGGISIEHQGFGQQPVRISNSVFRGNRCQVTGSAIDVLPGSSAEITNCLFTGNVSNTGPNYVGGPDNPYNEKNGCGAITVFPTATVRVERCTFTHNWNGADDKGQGNVYTKSIFWMNVQKGGISPGERYELDILDGQNVTDCFIHGTINDLRDSIRNADNRFDAPDPKFDENFVPLAAEYAGVGFRPAGE